MSEVYKLRFQEPIFRPGYNTTCRLGSKHWLALDVGDRIAICDNDEKVIFETEVLMVIYYEDFQDMGDDVIVTNHVARDLDSVFKVLKDAYPNTDWEEDQDVTVIGFDVPIEHSEASVVLDNF